MATHRSVLRSLGIVGYDHLEPVILAALATQTPLLLIGAHGTAKSLLLTRLAQALGLAWRHYNASLVNYDDLIGYPLPDAGGTLRFVQTPASIWGAQAVFIDELSRARPDMLNRLFPIIHERVVQGMPLDALRHRWAAMNPPTRQDDAVAGQDYLGSEALDPALADRFGFVITVPAWAQLTEADQAAVITSQDTQPDDAARRAVQEAIALIERELPLVLEYAGSAITDVVREVIRHAATLGVPLSGRRAAMLYRNIAAVHAARLAAQPAADIVESSWIAVSTSIPQRAQGIAVDDTRLMVAHDAAWKLARLSAGDPRRALATEPDPTRRAIRAAAMPQLSLQERSAYVADALAHLPAGGRHALAHWLVEQGLAAGLMTAVADQCGELYSLVASKQDVATKLSSSSQAYQAWRSIMSAIEEHDGAHADHDLLGNLLAGLFATGQLVRPIDTDAILASWKELRALLAERPALAAADAAPAVATARRARKRPHAAGAQQ
jgi:MoxR-like ATPase